MTLWYGQNPYVNVAGVFSIRRINLFTGYWFSGKISGQSGVFDFSPRASRVPGIG